MVMIITVHSNCYFFFLNLYFENAILEKNLKIKISLFLKKYTGMLYLADGFNSI